MLEYHDRDCASLEALLVQDVFVRRHHDFKTGLLDRVDQLAVCEFFLAPCPCLLHRMSREEAGKTSRCAVIEKNEHPGDDLAVARGFFERTRHKRHQGF